MDNADVIIVGAGDAGLSAAIESADAGAETIVFEKLASERASSSALSGGIISFAGTEFQKRNGIQDSDHLFFKDLMDVGQWKNDQKLVEVFINSQLNTYYWLTALGVKWFRLMAGGGMTVPRGHVTDPTEHIKILREAAEKKGAKISFRTRVTGISIGEDKRVIEVSAEAEGRSFRVKAGRGIVLATGGFGRDIKRLEAIDPRLSKVTVITGAGNTGDGHRMAEQVGAYFKHMEYIKPSFGIHASSKSLVTLSLLWWSGAILVNKEGKRFINESMDIKSIGEASLDQPDGISFQIFDHEILRKEEGRFELGKKTNRLLIEAETIEELAYKIGVPVKALRETVDRYNDGADKGKEVDFHRATLLRDFGRIMRIDTPPFYAIQSKAFLPATYGGIAVDEGMHVLSSHGRIPGLYGAGEIVGGFHGAGYHTGSALAKAIVFGRIAGRNAAKGQ